MSSSPKFFVLAILLSLLVVLASAAPTPALDTAPAPAGGAVLEKALGKATRGVPMRAVRSAEAGDVPAKPENSPVHGS
eukprot:CAMPEP_0174896146 /NCGR_PEP_ID=MMETSP0167-20121228/10387_1 /TAXON_ID=38298 /ORGANISM="Rhodella maculata, Strain CCMP736" /LENGTH=77 /DNA_ID=CAMNT_0016135629 /DNA_START=160 /DNA_END=393 /DNA_ORIENTATION=-